MENQMAVLITRSLANVANVLFTFIYSGFRLMVAITSEETKEMMVNIEISITKKGLMYEERQGHSLNSHFCLMKNS